MTDSKIDHYHHSTRPLNCSKGHSFRVRFKSKGDSLGWIKVCRRCEKVISKGGAFDSNGKWHEIWQPGEVSRDSGDTELGERNEAR